VFWDGAAAPASLVRKTERRALGITDGAARPNNGNGWTLARVMPDWGAVCRTLTRARGRGYKRGAEGAAGVGRLLTTLSRPSVLQTSMV